MSKKLLIIDGNNFYARGFFIAKPRKIDAIQQMITMFSGLRQRFTDTQFVFIFDTTKSKRRLELLPSYKHRESTMTEEDYKLFSSGLDTFIKIVKHSGYITIFGDGYEADDYIACLSQMTKMRYEVIIISTDQDMHQLIDTYVKVYDPMRGLIITTENYEHIFEIPLKYCLDFKCIKGDDSDKIPGIPGYGGKEAKRARQLIYTYGNLDSIFNGLTAKIPKKKLEQQFLDSMADGLIDLNLRLMDLRIPMKDQTLKALISQKSKSEANPELLYKTFLVTERSHLFDVWKSECMN